MKHPRVVTAVVISAIVIGGGGGLVLNAHADGPPPTGASSMVPYALPTGTAVNDATTTPKPTQSLPATAAPITTKPAATPTATKSPAALITSATAACHAQFAACSVPVVAQSAVSLMDFTPGADAALTAVSPAARRGTPVTINISNNLQNGEQDWTINTNNVVNDTIGMTTFDKASYRGDLIASIEYTPYGRDTGLCLQPGARGSTLQPCDGALNQEFILAITIPFDNTATHGYYYMLWAPQAANAQHHLALDAPGRIAGDVTVQRVINVGPNEPSTFMWDSMP